MLFLGIAMLLARTEPGFEPEGGENLKQYIYIYIYILMKIKTNIYTHQLKKRDFSKKKKKSKTQIITNRQALIYIYY